MFVRWGLASAVAIACAGATSSCSQDTTVDGVFTQDEWSLIQTMSPLPDVPADTTNAHADDPKAAALGQSLFFEKRVSGALAVGNDGTNGGLGNVGDTGKVACSDCHDSSHWFIDTRSKPLNTALGADWGAHRAPSLVDACFYQWYHWTGAFDVMWGSPLNSLENPKSMNGSRLLVAHVLYDHYKDAYNAAFQPPLPDALAPSAPSPSRALTALCVVAVASPLGLPSVVNASPVWRRFPENSATSVSDCGTRSVSKRMHPPAVTCPTSRRKRCVSTIRRVNIHDKSAVKSRGRARRGSRVYGIRCALRPANSGGARLRRHRGSCAAVPRLSSDRPARAPARTRRPSSSSPTTRGTRPRRGRGA